MWLDWFCIYTFQRSGRDDPRICIGQKPRTHPTLAVGVTCFCRLHVCVGCYDMSPILPVQFAWVLFYEYLYWLFINFWGFYRNTNCGFLFSLLNSLFLDSGYRVNFHQSCMTERVKCGPIKRKFVNISFHFQRCFTCPVWSEVFASTVRSLWCMKWLSSWLILSPRQSVLASLDWSIISSHLFSCYSSISRTSVRKRWNRYFL